MVIKRKFKNRIVYFLLICCLSSIFSLFSIHKTSVKAETLVDRTQAFFVKLMLTLGVAYPTLQDARDAYVVYETTQLAADVSAKIKSTTQTVLTVDDTLWSEARAWAQQTFFPNHVGEVKFQNYPISPVSYNTYLYQAIFNDVYLYVSTQPFYQYGYDQPSDTYYYASKGTNGKIYRLSNGSWSLYEDGFYGIKYWNGHINAGESSVYTDSTCTIPVTIEGDYSYTGDAVLGNPTWDWGNSTTGQRDIYVPDTVGSTQSVDDYLKDWVKGTNSSVSYQNVINESIPASSVDNPSTTIDDPAIPTDQSSFWTGIWTWFKKLLQSIADLPASIVGKLQEILDWLKSALSSLTDTISGAIDNIIKNLPKQTTEEDPEDDSNVPGLFNLLWLILLALIMLMLACFNMILSLFNIPASSAGMNENLVKGIDFMKNASLPGFGMSFFAVVTGVLLGIQVFALIKIIRKYIHKEFGNSV